MSFQTIIILAEFEAPQTTCSVSPEKTQIPMMSSVQRKADLVWDVPESPAKKIYVISHLQVSQIPKITSKK